MFTYLDHYIIFAHLMNPCIHIILNTLITSTALLLMSNAKVEKILCDQLSVNMAASPIFGTRELVTHASSRELLTLTQVIRQAFAKNKKENKSPYKFALKIELGDLK